MAEKLQCALNRSPSVSDRLGFAEVCIQCPLSTALARNALRATPIPDSTIAAMEKSLELPDPAHHLWEESSAVLMNDGEREAFTSRGW